MCASVLDAGFPEAAARPPRGPARGNGGRGQLPRAGHSHVGTEQGAASGQWSGLTGEASGELGCPRPSSLCFASAGRGPRQGLFPGQVDASRSLRVIAWGVGVQVCVSTASAVGSRVAHGSPPPTPAHASRRLRGKAGKRPRGQEAAPGKEREPFFSPQRHEALTPAPRQGLPHQGSLAPGGLACMRRPRALKGRGRWQGAPVGAGLGPRGRWAVAPGGSGPRWAEWGGDPGGPAVPGVSAPGWPCACGQVAGASGTSFSFPLGKGITQPLPEVAGTQMG